MTPYFAQTCERPAVLRRSHPRGAKAEGIRYEKALARAIPAAKRGQWFQYMDEYDGPMRYCQTDFLLPLDSETVAVIEAKLSWVHIAHQTLCDLYLPVVRLALGKLAVGIVACRNLRSVMPPNSFITGDMAEALSMAETSSNVILHWLPGTPIGAAKDKGI